jgi:GNAT superfamily N-acetyltransferase
MQKLWQEDIDCIKQGWWYSQLGPGSKRYLFYRISLIQYIIESAKRDDARVYRYGTESLGFVYDWQDHWWLGGLTVRPNLLKDVSGKSSGIGEKLLKHIELDAKRTNINRISLHPGAVGLHHFYQRLGYQPSGIRQNIGKVFAKEL